MSEQNRNKDARQALFDRASEYSLGTDNDAYGIPVDLENQIRSNISTDVTAPASRYQSMSADDLLQDSLGRNPLNISFEKHTPEEEKGGLLNSLMRGYENLMVMPDIAQQDVEEITKYYKDVQKYAPSDEEVAVLTKLMDMGEEDGNEFWFEVIKHPSAWVDVILESAAVSAVVGAAQAAGTFTNPIPGAGPIAGGATSATAELLSTIREGIEEHVEDPTDPEQVQAFFDNDELMAEYTKKGAIRGGAIGTVDGATMGAAGFTVRLANAGRRVIRAAERAAERAAKLKTATSQARANKLAGIKAPLGGRVKSAIATEALLLQPGAGALGEGLAQKLSGEELNRFDLAMEFFAEHPSGGIETTIGLFSDKNKQAKYKADQARNRRGGGSTPGGPIAPRSAPAGQVPIESATSTGDASLDAALAALDPVEPETAPIAPQQPEMPQSPVTAPSQQGAIPTPAGAQPPIPVIQGGLPINPVAGPAAPPIVEVPAPTAQPEQVAPQAIPTGVAGQVPTPTTPDTTTVDPTPAVAEQAVEPPSIPTITVEDNVDLEPNVATLVDPKDRSPEALTLRSAIQEVFKLMNKEGDTLGLSTEQRQRLGRRVAAIKGRDTNNLDKFISLFASYAEAMDTLAPGIIDSIRAGDRAGLTEGLYTIQERLGGERPPAATTSQSAPKKSYSADEAAGVEAALAEVNRLRDSGEKGASLIGTTLQPAQTLLAALVSASNRFKSAGHNKVAADIIQTIGQYSNLADVTGDSKKGYNLQPKVAAGESSDKKRAPGYTKQRHENVLAALRKAAQIVVANKEKIPALDTGKKAKAKPAPTKTDAAKQKSKERSEKPKSVQAEPKPEPAAVADEAPVAKAATATTQKPVAKQLNKVQLEIAAAVRDIGSLDSLMDESTIPELRQALKAMGLATVGKKSEMAKRLYDYVLLGTKGDQVLAPKAQKAIDADARAKAKAKREATAGKDKESSTPEPKSAPAATVGTQQSERTKSTTMFHGTSLKFNKFKLTDIGYHLGNEAQASSKGKTLLSVAVQPGLKLLRVSEPPNGAWHDPSAVEQVLLAAGIDIPQGMQEVTAMWRKTTDSILVTPKKSSLQYKQLERMRNLMIAQGYDGIVYSNEYEGNKSDDSLILFSPDFATIEEEVTTKAPAAEKAKATSKAKQKGGRKKVKGTGVIKPVTPSGNAANAAISDVFLDLDPGSKVEVEKGSGVIAGINSTNTEEITLWQYAKRVLPYEVIEAYRWLNGAKQAYTDENTGQLTADGKKFLRLFEGVEQAEFLDDGSPEKDIAVARAQDEFLSFMEQQGQSEEAANNLGAAAVAIGEMRRNNQPTAEEVVEAKQEEAVSQAMGNPELEALIAEQTAELEAGDVIAPATGDTYTEVSIEDEANPEARSWSDDGGLNEEGQWAPEYGSLDGNLQFSRLFTNSLHKLDRKARNNIKALMKLIADKDLSDGATGINTRMQQILRAIGDRVGPNYPLMPLIEALEKEGSYDVELGLVSDSEFNSRHPKDQGATGAYDMNRKIRIGKRDLVGHPSGHYMTVRYDTSPEQFVQTFLHEAVHGATVAKYFTDPEFKAKIDRLYNQAKKQFEASPWRPIYSNKVYGFTDQLEFIAEAFVDPEFQRILARMQTDRTDPSSTIWNKLRNMIGKVLGLKSDKYSILDAVMDATDFDTAETLAERKGMEVMATRKGRGPFFNRGVPKQPRRFNSQFQLHKANDLLGKYRRLLDTHNNYAKADLETVLEDISKVVVEGSSYDFLIKKLQQLGINPEFGLLNADGMEAVVDGPAAGAFASYVEKGKRDGTHKLVNPEGKIFLNVYGLDAPALVHTILHEAVHAATHHKLLTDPKFKKRTTLLLTKAREAWAARGIPNSLDYYGVTSASEFIAEAFTNPAFQNFLSEIGVSEELTAELGGIHRTDMWTAFKDLVYKAIGKGGEGVRNLLDTVLDFTEFDDAIDIMARDGMEVEDVIRYPLMPAEKAKQKSNAKKHTKQLGVAQRKTKNLFKSQRSKALNLQTVDQIVRRNKDVFSVRNIRDTIVNPLKDWYDANMRRIKEARDIHHEAREHVRRFDVLDNARKLPFQQFMLDTTSWEIYAHAALTDSVNAHLTNSKGKIDPRVVKMHEKLSAQWKGMTAEEKQLYSDMVDAGAKVRESTLEALMERLGRSWKIDEAPIVMKKLRQVRSAAQFDELLAEHGLEVPQLGDARATAKAILRELNVKGPYLPMRRFGNYVASANRSDTQYYATEEEAQAAADEWTFQNKLNKAKVTGSEVEFSGRIFSIHDSLDAAEQAALEYSQDGYQNAVAKEKEASSLASAAGVSSVIRQMGDKIKDPSVRSMVDNAVAELLAANVNQASKLRRENVPGVNPEEMMRGYAERMYGAGWNIGDIKTSYDIEQSLNDMSKLTSPSRASDVGVNATANPDYQRRQQVYNHIRKIEEGAVADRTSPAVSRALGATGFLWYLASPSYSFVNASQVGLVAAPYLGAKYGAGKATKSLIGMYRQVFSPVIKGLGQTKMGVTGTEEAVYDNIVEVLNSKENKAKGFDQAFKSLTDLNIIDATFIQELMDTVAGTHTTGKAGRGISDRVMTVARTLPMAIETMNRVVVGLSAYELAKGSHEQRVEAAAEAIRETQFDYSTFNRPTWFKQNAAMRGLMMFKMYPQGIYSLLATQLGNMRKEGKKAEAYAITSGLIATHTLAAGVLGGVMLEPLRLVLTLFGEALGKEEEEDFDSWARRIAVESVGLDPEWAKVVLEGVPNMVGMNLYSRVGLHNLVTMQAPNFDDKAGFVETMLSLLGPLGQIPVRGFEAYQAIRDEGDYVRAIEKAAPVAWIRQIAKGTNLSANGMTDFRGNLLVGNDKFDYWDIALTSLGFQTTGVSEVYSARRASVSREYDVNRKRSQLMKDYRQAKTPGERAKATSKIREFNATYGKDFKIEKKNIRQSYKSQKERERATRKGVFSEKRSTRRIADRYATPED